MRINRIEVKLPYPIRVGLFFIERKKNVGFSFDNLSIFLLKENLKLKDSAELKAWVEKRSTNELMVESLLSAHQSFCLWEKKKSIPRDKFMDGIGRIKKEELTKVIEVWQQSETFGAKSMPGKKKAVKS